MVVFKAECLRELIRCMLANSCVVVLEVLTDNSDLRVERRSAGTDTKSAEFHSRQPQEKQEDVHTMSTWPVAWHLANEVFGLVRVTSPLTMKYELMVP